MSRKILNASEMGRKGGKRLVEIRGNSYMAEIASRGRKTVRERDPDYYRRLSEAGVKARKAKKQKEAKEKRSLLDKLGDIVSGQG